MKIKTLVLTVSVVVFSCGIASAQAAGEPALEPVEVGQSTHPASLSLPGIVLDPAGTAVDRAMLPVTTKIDQDARVFLDRQLQRQEQALLDSPRTVRVAAPSADRRGPCCGS